MEHLSGGFSQKLQFGQEQRDGIVNELLGGDPALETAASARTDNAEANVAAVDGRGTGMLTPAFGETLFAASDSFLRRLTSFLMSSREICSNGAVVKASWSRP